MWSRFYGSTFFVDYFLTTGPHITWTFALLDTEFQAQKFMFCLLTWIFFWLRGKFIWQLTSLRTRTHVAAVPKMNGN
jgi:hypothetical protein